MSPRAKSSSPWEIRLYVAGRTPRSARALANLKKICEKEFAGRYRIEVVDLLANPERAAADQILAVPSVVRRLPLPVRKIIGDLSDAEHVLVGLQVSNLEERT